MDHLSLPLFEDAHRRLGDALQRFCDERLAPLVGSENEDTESACVEYSALLGQEGLYDPVVGPALEGDAPKPNLRALCVVRSKIARTSGLCDATYGTQCQGMYPIALAGKEDQRAIYLPGMASGQRICTLALLDDDDPLRVKKENGRYRIKGGKVAVPLAQVADVFVALARHEDEDARTPRFSLFILEKADITPSGFVSPMPVGSLAVDGMVDEEQRLGGEGQGLVVVQATLDILRLPTASACIGLAHQAILRGTMELNERGIGGRALREQQGAQWEIARSMCETEGALAMIFQTAYKRDISGKREVRATSMARQLAQNAAENATTTIANLIGLRGLMSTQPWSRLLAEARALRFESEFLENPHTLIARALMSSLEKNQPKS